MFVKKDLNFTVGPHPLLKSPDHVIALSGVGTGKVHLSLRSALQIHYNNTVVKHAGTKAVYER